MSLVSAATLLAAALFAAFHLPIPVVSRGKPAQLIGVCYHLLLLPAVAALPAPEWARVAGFAWMLFDIALDGGSFTGLSARTTGPLRQGVHVIASVWVVFAGWSNGGWAGTAGSLLAVAFIVRFLCEGFGWNPGAWIKHVNAVLNVLWFVCVAVVLW